MQIDTSETATDALERIREVDYDAIVTDIKMPGMDGLALLEEIGKVRPGTPTLLITGHGEHDLAVQALRGGAYDFVAKPIDRDYFIASLERAIGMRRLDREVERQRLALQRHASVLEHVDDGVFLVDDSGVIQHWNPAAAAITGLTPSAVLGQRADDVLPDWRAVCPTIPVASAPGPGSTDARTLPFVIEGREVWLSISGVAFEDGVVYAFRNLTEERALDELKGEFVATVSHELRTPLAAIYGSAQTLLRDDIDDRRRQAPAPAAGDRAGVGAALARGRGHPAREPDRLRPPAARDARRSTSPASRRTSSSRCGRASPSATTSPSSSSPRSRARSSPVTRTSSGRS